MWGLYRGKVSNASDPQATHFRVLVLIVAGSPVALMEITIVIIIRLATVIAIVIVRCPWS